MVKEWETKDERARWDEREGSFLLLVIHLASNHCSNKNTLRLIKGTFFLL